MSDYLSRLVKRSLEPADVIKPRLTSLFEPPVQGEPVFGVESGSNDLNVSPTSDETESNDLPLPRASTHTSSGTRVLTEVHQSQVDTDLSQDSTLKQLNNPIKKPDLNHIPPQNTKPHLEPDAVQPTKPESQQILDPLRSDQLQSVSVQELAPVLPQLTQQTSKPDQAEPPSDNNNSHDILHRTDNMRRQPSGQNPGIPSVEISSSPPDSPRLTQQTSKPDQAAPLSDNNKSHDILHRTDNMGRQPLDQNPDIPPAEISSSPPDSPQLTQQTSIEGMTHKPSEQSQAPQPLAYDKTHDMPHQTNNTAIRSSAQDQDIMSVAIKSITSQEKMQIAKPAQPAVIKVTIGRIEVRAVTPPAPIPQQRVKQPSPVLSLDEYLRLRNGGEL